MRPGLVNFASVTGPRVTLIVAFTRTCFRFTGAGSSPGGLLACNLSLLPILLVLVIYFPRARRPVLKNPIPFRFQPCKGWSIESRALWPAPCLSPGSLRHSLPTLPDHLRQDADLPGLPARLSLLSLFAAEQGRYFPRFLMVSAFQGLWDVPL